MGYLNARLGNLRDEREEYLATALEGRGLVNMIDHFLTRMRYWVAGSWKWSMQREGKRVTGRGEYILSTDRSSFTSAELQETRHVTDHRTILVVPLVEGALCNHNYRRGQTCWPIRPKSVQPQTKGEAAFVYIKGGITNTPRPKKARAS